MHLTRTLTLAVALGLPVGAAMSALADARTVAFAEETLSGTIKSVDTSSSKFVLTTSDGDKTLSVTNTTKYTLDGKDSTLSDALKSGYTARVTHKDMKASLVAASSGKK